MPHLLSFWSSISDEGANGPPGLWIAEHLRRQLPQHGVKTGRVDNHNHFAWRLDCKVRGGNAGFFVGYLGAPNGEWQLVVESFVPWLRKLGGASEERVRRRLAVGIHEVLSADARFQDLRWSKRFHPREPYPWSRTPAS